MKKSGTIHNLDGLEKEIYRLQIEAINTEKKLSGNIDWLHHNTSEIILRSLLRRKRKFSRQNEGALHFFKNEAVNRFVSALAERIAIRAADSLDGLVNGVLNGRAQRL